MKKSRFFIEVAYFGKNYHGWQVQNNAVSVQERLNDALAILLRVPTETIGAGRTDAGVHAKQLFVHFDADATGILANPERFLYALNGLLPHDISVKSVVPIHEDAHARFDAIRRSYEYHLHFEKDPFRYEYSSFLRDIPDVEKMNKAAEFLLGKRISVVLANRIHKSLPIYVPYQERNGSGRTKENLFFILPRIDSCVIWYVL